MNKKKTLVIVAVAAIAALAVWLLSGGKKEEKLRLTRLPLRRQTL